MFSEETAPSALPTLQVSGDALSVGAAASGRACKGALQESYLHTEPYSDHHSGLEYTFELKI